ncbi:VUT family protein [Streptomyces niveus]|uniref:VUT family protein n=1 Tax=Streptomyces niveus TaxID=193462 RepID=UPI00364E1840
MFLTLKSTALKAWRSTRVRAGLSAFAYVAGVVVTNVVTASFGLWPVGFGLAATAGTMFAGVTFVLRDVVQEAAGKKAALAALAVGCGISAFMATPALAAASVAAFGLAELLDMGVYTKLRKRGWMRAAVASNVVGAVVDTFVFLLVAGFPVTAISVTGQLVGKGWATVAVVGPVAGYRLAKYAKRYTRSRRAVSDHAVRG